MTSQQHIPGRWECQECGCQQAAEIRYMVNGEGRYARLCINCSDNRVRRTLIEDALREEEMAHNAS